MGVRDRHGFVGPLGSRLAVESDFLDSVAREPIFEDADRLAPAGPLHLVKPTLDVERPGRWRRSLKIDGHAVSHVDSDAPIAAPAPGRGCSSASPCSITEIVRTRSRLVARSSTRSTRSSTPWSRPPGSIRGS